jgi:predicted phage terminase large subunit-like protein
MPAFELTAKQKEATNLLASPAKHVMLYGGSRSGKTFTLVRAIVVRALKAPASRHAILRFRFNHVKHSIGMDTMPAVMSRCYPGLNYRVDKSDWYFELPNGSQIWLGGLDDKERTEKILGQEYATTYLNECSQIPWSSRNLAVTRLAQRVPIKVDGLTGDLPLKAYYDCNPANQAHWTYRLFRQGLDPDTKRPIEGRQDYAYLQMNPADNVANLPADYITELERLPARLRRRFLAGEFGEAAADALWTDEGIDTWRIVDGDLPDMQRVVVAVDPSGADDIDNADNDEIGIVVCGLGTDGRGYLLEDLTFKGGPAKWGRAVTEAFERHQADAVVAETNYGGAMVKHVIHTARPRTPFKAITASRGKVVRAEPISSLCEQGRIRFVGYFHNLEDELVSFTTHGYTGENSPNRADAFVWAMSELFPGLVKEADKSEQEDAHFPTGQAAWMA